MGVGWGRARKAEARSGRREKGGEEERRTRRKAGRCLFKTRTPHCPAQHHRIPLWLGTNAGLYW
eukprot:4286372-Pyramimonas_sp.AAC.1